MLTIQEVGAEILSGNPGKFYVLAGREYGIKCRYLDILESYYGIRKESPSVASVLEYFSVRHLVMDTPSLYVVRYDDSFISSLTDKSESKIESTNIRGTVIVLLENDKQHGKLEKYLSRHYTVIDSVSSKYVEKYLHSEFPGLPEDLINKVVHVSNNYSQSRILCNLIRVGGVHDFQEFSESQLKHFFNIDFAEDDMNLKNGIASRNFNYVINLLDTRDNLDSVYYSIFSVLLELEKLKISKSANSSFIPYVSRWTLEDIYNMFMQTYHQLKIVRTISSDYYSSIILLLSLMQFKRIPSLEEIS